MRVLVTGSTGMLGSALARQLVSQNHEVRILRRKSSRLDLLEDVVHAVQHFEGDIMVPESLDEATRGIDAVFHAAATVGFSQNNSSSDDPYVANHAGTANVANAILRNSPSARMVHTSSIAALGRSPGQTEPITEDATWTRSSLNSAYAVSKHRAEMEVLRAVAEGLDAVMLNPSMIFGEGRPDENTSQVFQKVRDGKVPGIPVGGTNVVDVKDVVSGHLLALERGKTGERYTLGGENLLWSEIFATIASALGVQLTERVLNPKFLIPISHVVAAVSKVLRRKALITPETARITARFFKYDISKAQRDLGYSFRSFHETAERLASRFTG